MENVVIPSNLNKKGTNYLNSNHQLDTDIREYKTLPTNIPSKQRAVRLHIPQIIEPIILVDMSEITIGRAKGENRLDLSRQYANLLGVSRNHATLAFDNGEYSVTDLGSTNGTFLNGIRLDPNLPYVVKQNDQLRFGHFVTVFECS